MIRDGGVIGKNVRNGGNMFVGNWNLPGGCVCVRVAVLFVYVVNVWV